MDRHSSISDLHLAVLLTAVTAVCLCSCEQQPPDPSNQVAYGRSTETLSETSATTSAISWWTDITDDAGIDFVHEPGRAGRFLLPEVMGAGCAMLDADGDGRLDLYLTNGHTNLPDPQGDGTARNRLLLQTPDGRFRDHTDASGLGDTGYGMGVSVGDIDNDGDLDIHIANFGPDRLFRNAGDGTFEDVTALLGVDLPGWSSSSTFVDYDADGDLDLFVCQYVAFEAKSCSDRAGRADFCGPRSFNGVADVLLRNDGDVFVDVSADAGMTSVAAAGLGVVAADINEDGHIDLFVANDAHPNHLWISNGDGTFTECAARTGTARNMHGLNEAGMGVLAEDFDGDLDLDLFLTHQVLESNTFYRNHGRASGFEDASGESGLGPPSLPSTGFGTAAMDLELDGDLDILVACGRVIRGTPDPRTTAPSPWNRYAEANQIYVNQGTGMFLMDEIAGGDFCRAIDVSRGLSVGDIDSDGDLDVLVTAIAGPARLFRNDAPRHGRWLAVRAFDPALSRDADGAVVIVATGDRRQIRRASRGFGYQSSRVATVYFGLGEADTYDWIEIRWPGGHAERFPGGSADRLVELDHGSGKSPPG